MKNLITLHEAVAIILLKKAERTATFEDIANEIERRKLFENRKGNIPLSEQIRIRTAIKTSRYKKWFVFTKPDVLKLDLYSKCPEMPYFLSIKFPDPIKALIWKLL